MYWDRIEDDFAMIEATNDDEAMAGEGPLARAGGELDSIDEG